ncbi:M6 family metalloprotease domain-containing protein, partial [Streptomyces calidiresistens]|uniref:M6 family metalloprotease domain-containing protein n=1 Tax=Streptomyces calidiresistens TaxID=1485586 RepID=UPI002B208458
PLPPPAFTAAGSCALPGGEGLHAGIPTPPGFAPSVGTVRALTLFIDFPDAEARIDTTERFAEFFPAGAEYFATASYGRMDYRPDPVHRWLRMSRPFEEYGIDRGVGWHPDDPAGYNALMRDIVDAVAGEVDFSSYDVVNVLATPNAGPSALETVLSVSFPGRPLVDTPTGPLQNVSFIWSSQPGDSPHRVLVHENGHAFGLPDLYWTGAGEPPLLTGHWDVMEQDWGPSNGMLAWHRWKLEWLTDDQVDCVVEAGVTEHRIVPLGTPPGDDRPEPDPETETGAHGRPGSAGTAPRADTPDGAPPARPERGGPLRPPGAPASGGTDTRLVALRVGPRQVITLEVRAPSALDHAVCRAGVLITRVDTGARTGEGPMRVEDATPGSGGCHDPADPQLAHELSDAAFLPGDTFHDPRAGVRVQVLEAEEDGSHRVRVTRW